ncbi:unnamed protein product [Leptosia nina]|uniref:Uncharacterized protein n=1 Tax=Leptosia nina TaxID=320188 RepID=A0AAV1JKN7_9NEOP
MKTWQAQEWRWLPTGYRCNTSRAIKCVTTSPRRLFRAPVNEPSADLLELYICQNEVPYVDLRLHIICEDRALHGIRPSGGKETRALRVYQFRPSPPDGVLSCINLGASIQPSLMC